MKNLSKKVFYRLFFLQAVLALFFFTPLFTIRHFSTNYSIDTLIPVFLCGGFMLLVFFSGFFLALNYASLHKTLKPVVHMAEVGDTAGKVAHDLRGPMAGIESVLQSLEELESRDSGFGKQVDLLHLSYDRLRNVSEDLLLKQQGKEEAARSFDLHEVLDRLIGEYESQSSLSAVSFRKEYADQAVTVCGQKNKMTRMFGNLIKNALEAMKLKGRLVCRTAVIGETVRVTIGDSGPGMTAERVAQILSGESFTDGKSDGHGIGLSVVREVLKSHRGELEIESELGKGTDFILSLPQQAVIATASLRSGKQSRLDRHVALRAPRDDAGYNVLVIDDELPIRMSWELKQQMLSIGDLRCYANLEELQSNGIDLTTIDIAFIDKNISGSNFSGAEVLRYLRKKGIPKIVIASGENNATLANDPQFSDADHILSEKIPATLEGLV